MDTTNWISQDRITHIRTESYTLSPRPTDHCFSSRTKFSNSFPQSRKKYVRRCKKNEFCNKQNLYISTVHWCHDMQTRKTLNRIASNKVSLESSPCIVRRGEKQILYFPTLRFEMQHHFFSRSASMLPPLSQKNAAWSSKQSLPSMFPKCHKKNHRQKLDKRRQNTAGDII